MATVVLTQKVAADRLGVTRHEVAQRLASGALTPASVDDRPAVLVDAKYEAALQDARQVAV